MGFYIKIFGVWHSGFVLEETLQRIDEYLDYQSPNLVMVELPINYDELMQKGLVRRNSFFGLIAEHFQKKGSSIIYGDKELVFPDRPLTLVDFLFPQFTFDSEE